MPFHTKSADAVFPAESFTLIVNNPPESMTVLGIPTKYALLESFGSFSILIPGGISPSRVQVKSGEPPVKP